MLRLKAEIAHLLAQALTVTLRWVFIGANPYFLDMSKGEMLGVAH